MTVMPFLGGLLTGLLVAAGGTYFQRLSTKKKTQEEMLFRVYMLLLDLNAAHFWIASREVRSEEPDSRHAKKFHDLAWQIADLLRQLDKLKELPEIVNALFGLQFPSEVKRGEEISRLIDLLSKRVNPRYSAAMKQVDSNNLRLMTESVERFFERKKQIEP